MSLQIRISCRGAHPQPPRHGKLVRSSGLLAALRVIFCEGDADSAIVRNCVGGHFTKWQFCAKGLAVDSQLILFRIRASRLVFTLATCPRPQTTRLLVSTHMIPHLFATTGSRPRGNWTLEALVANSWAIPMLALYTGLLPQLLN